MNAPARPPRGDLPALCGVAASDRGPVAVYADGGRAVVHIPGHRFSLSREASRQLRAALRRFDKGAP